VTRACTLALSTFAFLLPFAAKTAHAQRQHDRVPVQISCACNDEVGKAYLRALHASLASSDHFREASREEATASRVIHVDVASHALPAAEGSSFGRTAIEILCEHDGATMRQSVETCDRLPVDVVAQSMLSALKTL
jgi:hypothetical protein